MSYPPALTARAQGKSWAAYLKPAAPLLLAALFSFLDLQRALPRCFSLEYPNFQFGGLLLAGVKDFGVTLNMPLFQVVVAAALHAGITAGRLFLFLHFAAYLLVFLDGCLLGGYAAGLTGLAAAGLLRLYWGADWIFPYEQVFYACLLLLAQMMLTIRAREGSARASALSGLAIGAGLLARTPLFFLPPLLALGDLRRRGLRRGLAAALLLLCSYLPLAPWSLLNRRLYGEFRLTDSARAACNLITAANGSVFTMEGDCSRLAAPAQVEDPHGFYFGEWVRSPLFQAGLFLKRLWAVFLFYPLLFSLLAAAVALAWRNEDRSACILPVYFVAVHCLLSVEVRYFLPLLFLAPPLMASQLALRLRRREACPAAPAAAKSVLVLALCLVAATEALLLAYPARAAKSAALPGAYAKASLAFPRDGLLLRKACRELWLEGDDAAFRACLARPAAGLEDAAGLYYLAVSSAASPSAVPLPDCGEQEKTYLQALILRMLREAELGKPDEASASAAAALAVFGRNYNRLQGFRRGVNDPAGLRAVSEPYERDKALAARIAGDTDRFWDKWDFEMLLQWPPRRMAVILSGLDKARLLGGSLGRFRSELSARLARGRADEKELRSWIAGRGDGAPPAPAAGLRDMRPGETAAPPGPAGTGRAAPQSGGQPAAGGRTPGAALLERCTKPPRAASAGPALQACMEVLARAELDGGASFSRGENCAAARAAYGLLKAAGREKEAGELLAWQKAGMAGCAPAQDRRRPKGRQ